MRTLKASWPGLIAVLLLVAALELLVRVGALNEVFVPPPSEIGQAFLRLLFHGRLIDLGMATLLRTLGGYLIAMIIAVPVGVVMGEWFLVRRTLLPLVELLRPVPSAVIIPVAIVVLGIGETSRLAVIVFGSLWPTIVSTMESVGRVDTVLVDTGRTLNYSRLSVLMRIILPAAAPGIATGMRISLSIALILSVTVEMFFGGTGLGFLVIDSERSFQYPTMFAGVLAVTIIGYTANGLFVILERFALNWHYQMTSRKH